jgi:uracil phosphoribosyltransferase
MLAPVAEEAALLKQQVAQYMLVEVVVEVHQVRGDFLAMQVRTQTLEQMAHQEMLAQTDSAQDQVVVEDPEITVRTVT